MAVALRDTLLAAVQLGAEGTGQHMGGVSTQAHGRAHGGDVLLLLLQANDGVGRVVHKLRGVGIRQAQHVARNLDDRHLHAQANAQEGDVVLAGVLHGLDLALHPAVAEAAGHQNAVHGADHLSGVAALQGLGIHAHDLHAAIIRRAGVGKALVDGFVRILQRDVLAHHRNAHAVRGVNDAAHELLPVVHLGLRHGNAEHFGHDAVHAVAAQV